MNVIIHYPSCYERQVVRLPLMVCVPELLCIKLYCAFAEFLYAILDFKTR